jgi:molybdopterin molybdotransferase
MPVAQALERILAAFSPLPPETVSVAEAGGRVLAKDLTARVTQPPAAVSAMDGYAVRAADVAKTPVTLTQIGESAAGDGLAGSVGQGQCARIFTGAPVPDGADAIVIQEDTVADGAAITIGESVVAGRYVRPAGLDFLKGDVLLRAGRILTARDVGLAAAMNIPWIEVRRRPRIALLATGDEIVRPGDPIAANQVLSSNGIALAALVRAHGGAPIDLGIAVDSKESLMSMAGGARGADLLVTMGGASVGDHDLVQSALGERGLEIDFWRIAMRPGKPLMFGDIGGTPLIGLPGNPVSSLVCGLVFVIPALHRMLGREGDDGRRESAILGTALPANDRREDYLRATLDTDGEGRTVAVPFEKQDSSMLSLLARSQCLVVRPPHAEAAQPGERVEIIRLDVRGAGI